MPDSAPVMLGEPSAVGAAIRPKALLEAGKVWFEFVKKLPDSPLEKAPPEVKEYIPLVVGTIEDFVGASKGTFARTYKQGEYHVDHTWSHFDPSK